MHRAEGRVPCVGVRAEGHAGGRMTAGDVSMRQDSLAVRVFMIEGPACLALPMFD